LIDNNLHSDQINFLQEIIGKKSKTNGDVLFQSFENNKLQPLNNSESNKLMHGEFVDSMHQNYKQTFDDKINDQIDKFEEETTLNNLQFSKSLNSLQEESTFMKTKFINNIDQLNWEIDEESNKVAKFLIDFDPFKNYIISFLESIIFQNFSESSEEIEIIQYGSHASRLALKTSDLDLAIVGLEFDKKEELIELIQYISNEIQKDYVITSCENILSASIPIIKLVI